MDTVERTLNTAVADRTIPNAIVYATNKDGSFRYSSAVGRISAEADATEITQDAVLAIASQSKLISAVAALQAVEQGLFNLDDDVAALLPELAAQPILKGFNTANEPILSTRKNTITLRHLLTHTSGATYSIFDSDLEEYLSRKGVTPYTGTEVVSRFAYPLIFEPGERWMYGTGLDWAGLLIERLTNLSLESFMKQHIWDPLGLRSMAFFPFSKPEIVPRVPKISVRDSDAELSVLEDPFFTTGLTGCFGGYGIYSDMGDYLSLLQSLLANDGKILTTSSLEELFKPQLTQQQATAMKEVLSSPLGALFTGEISANEYDHGWALGGLVFLEGYRDNRRKAGSMSWGGSANCWWIIDRQAELAITFGTQVVALRDQKVKDIISMTELEIYAMAEVHKA